MGKECATGIVGLNDAQRRALSLVGGSIPRDWRLGPWRGGGGGDGGGRRWPHPGGLILRGSMELTLEQLDLKLTDGTNGWILERLHLTKLDGRNYT